jgi:tetratricopeptide (TPR) repeat protein
MRDERWSEARAELERLFEAPPDVRQLELAALEARDAALGAWVRALLRQDDELEARRGPGGGPDQAVGDRQGLGDCFGPYTLLRPLGRGGMGEVYAARRSDGAFERDVAIKRLAPGLVSEELVQRFLRERQTLARLDHEYIARLLDGGTTENGEPYLVMELVEGERVDLVAARLDVTARLALFLKICRAVVHAHERGVIHRDLKPPNILVRPDGTPRLLDFGIARLLDGSGTAGDAKLTRTGHRLFTPEYASPEQVRGEAVTAQSDVFALGVLLYELLTGTRPFQSEEGLRALERKICESEPEPPRRRVGTSTRERLPGDVDAVVLQCLAKRPAERYRTVAALCEDVERLLDGRPVLARRIGPLGRFARLVRRRPVHALAGAALALALAAGLAMARSRAAAERRSMALRQAVADQIAQAVRLGTDRDLTGARAALDAALASLEELPGEHGLWAEALSRQAVFASFAGEWDESLRLVDEGLATLARLPEPDHVLEARLLNSRAFALQQSLPGERSAEAYRVALEHTLEHVPTGDVLRVDARTGWAHELRRLGREEEYLAGLAEAVVEAHSIADPQRQVLARALNEEAVALSRAGRLDESATRYAEALEILTWNHGERHPSVAKVRHNHGALLVRAGRPEAAVEPLQRALVASREAGLAEVEASCHLHLARAHLALGRLVEAENAAREALRIREALRLREAPDLAGPRAGYDAAAGVVFAARGHQDEALTLLQAALAEPDQGLLPRDLELQARSALAELLSARGDSTTAAEHLTRAIELARELGSDEVRRLEERLASLQPAASRR